MSIMTINFISNFANCHKATEAKENKPPPFINLATGSNLGSCSEFFSYCVCSFVSLNPERFLSLSVFFVVFCCFFLTLTVLKSTGLLFCTMFFSTHLSAVPLIRLGLCTGGGILQKGGGVLRRASYQEVFGPFLEMLILIIGLGWYLAGLSVVKLLVCHK